MKDGAYNTVKQNPFKISKQRCAPYQDGKCFQKAILKIGLFY